MSTTILPSATGFGYGTVGASIDADDTTLTVQSGQGARFPDPSGNLDRGGNPLPFYIVVFHSSYSLPHLAYWTGGQAEIMKVTDRVGDSFTVDRGRGGTTPIVITTEYTVMEAFCLPTYEAIDAAIDAAKKGEYDVREWGVSAISDDNTDNFNQALSDIQSLGGGRLIVPQGDFLFQGQIVPKSEVHVVGQGMVPTKLTYTETTGNFIASGDSDLDNFGLERLTVRATNTVDGSTGWGIYLPQTAYTIRRFLLKEALVSGFTNGAFLKNTVHCHYTHSYITGRGKTKAGSIGFKLGTDLSIGGALDTSDTGGNSYVSLNMYIASFENLMESAAQNALIEGSIFEVAYEGLRIGKGNTRLVSPYFGSTGSMTTCDIRCMGGNGIRVDSYGSQSWNILFGSTSADVRSLIIPERMDFVPETGTDPDANRGFRVSRVHIYNHGSYCSLALGSDDIVGFRSASDNSGLIDTSFQRESAGVLKFNQSIKVVGALIGGPYTEKTIASGAIAVGGLTRVSVDTESDDATDDLVTATGGVDGQRLILKGEDAARTVTVTDSVGADTFALAGSVSFALHPNNRLELEHNGTKWFEISRSSNS